jgi:hypothetical protein
MLRVAWIILGNRVPECVGEQSASDGGGHHGSSIAGAELVENVPEVRLDRGHTHAELRGDVLRRLSLRGQSYRELTGR